MDEITLFNSKMPVNNKNSKHSKENLERDPKWKGCKSVDLDEIFQFSAAKQRALERNAEIEYEQPFKNYMQHRVFINHVDSFNGRIIVDYLSEQTITVLKSESSPDGEEDADPEEEEGNILTLSDEDNEEESMKEKEPDREKNKTNINFEIIGTADFMKNPEYTRPESVHEILDEEKKEEFLAKVLTCGFIIYDISNTLSCHPVQIEEATWILNSILNQLEEVHKQAPKLFKQYKDCRTFILISTLMTWAKTKPIDPDEPSLPFTERDYRKRKPHPNYKVHHEFEKKVLESGKKFPEHLRTIVIGSGVTYGLEEDILHFLFKMAWLNTPELPLFKPGNNIVPLIHVSALANVVYKIINDFPTSIKYIIAVEETSTSLKKIVKLISDKLGSGKIIKISKEKALTYPEIKQRNFDMLTINLQIIPGFIINNMERANSSEFSFSENIDVIVDEYRTARNLKPIKIFIHGPPASGKSYLSKRLANYYQAHYLNAKDVIEQGIADLKKTIQELKHKEGKGSNLGNKGNLDEELEDDDKEEEDIDEDEDEDEQTESLESLSQMLNEIEDNMAHNEKNRLDEQYVIWLFKKRMLANPCQNQGFIIDGYPKTLEDTKTLYEPEETEKVEEDDEKSDDILNLCNRKIIPDMVASLDGNDEFLLEKVILMPESLIQNTHYQEEDMCRRLVHYRALNTEENTPLIFYDELDVKTKIYNVQCDDLDFILNDIIRELGPPRNYGASQRALEQHQEKQRMDEKRFEQIKLKSAEIIKERREKMENWMFLKNQEKEMEEKALALLAMPLRHYLMKYIFPTLTRGLVEVARVRPQDPVDYLAEFIFKENPEGKMFHPNYDNIEEELLHCMEDFTDIKDQKFEENPPKSFSTDESIVPDAISNVTEAKSKLSLRSSVSTKMEKTMTPGQSESSSGSCKCKRISSQSSSSSTPPAPASECNCPPYYKSERSASGSTSSSQSSSSRTLKTRSCKC